MEGLPEEEMEVDDKGYEIEHLSFTRDDPEEHPDVVRIDLTLKHRQSGYTYSTFRYVESSGSDQEDEILLQ